MCVRKELKYESSRMRLLIYIFMADAFLFDLLLMQFRNSGVPEVVGGVEMVT